MNRYSEVSVFDAKPSRLKPWQRNLRAVGGFLLFATISFGAVAIKQAVDPSHQPSHHVHKPPKPIAEPKGPQICTDVNNNFPPISGLRQKYTAPIAKALGVGFNKFEEDGQLMGVDCNPGVLGREVFPKLEVQGIDGPCVEIGIKDGSKTAPSPDKIYRLLVAACVVPNEAIV
jgi:hypothetical protein